MRELMLGPQRFSDLRAGLPGISANVLTQRLEGLITSGIVRRRRLPPPAASQVFELTEWGQEAEPILKVLGRWAARSPFHDPTRPFSTASLVLSLRTMFDADRAIGESLRVRLELAHQTVLVEVEDGWLEAGPADPDDMSAVAATLTGDARGVAAFVYGGVPLADLEAAGALRVSGDRAALERLPVFFPLPERAEAPAG